MTDTDRIAKLEEEVKALQAELTEIRTQISRDRTQAAFTSVELGRFKPKPPLARR